MTPSGPRQGGGATQRSRSNISQLAGLGSTTGGHRHRQEIKEASTTIGVIMYTGRTARSSERCGPRSLLAWTKEGKAPGVLCLPPGCAPRPTQTHHHMLTLSLSGGKPCKA